MSELAYEFELSFKRIISSDLLQELIDEFNTFPDNTHHRPYTYAKGCRGPLCTKVERERRRNNRHEEAAESGRELETRSTMQKELDIKLDVVKLWYLDFKAKAAIQGLAS
jgi:hypothetical protein